MATPTTTAAAALTPEEEQDKLIEEAKNVVKAQAFYMKRCLDNGKLMDALKHASNMISELRTSLLSPKAYYGLYITVFDHLRHLESYLMEEHHGKKMSELYELVQYAGNILPRLYLLVTVGSVYIKSKDAAAKDVLRDLVEMCRGVQHPTRGLFLRNYLSEVTKDKLPDIGSPYEGKGGDVKDSVDFILLNFTEMNKLWVRMQHQGAVRDKERRENERLELRILVGKNLSRLSQLEGLDVDYHAKVVLPRVFEQIISCKDRIAQQYLMEVVIQIFSDEFHLATLEQILAACGQLQSGVDIKTIIISLIDRLAQYATKSPETIPNSIDIFNTFFVHVGKVIEQRPNMEVQDVLSLQVSLLNLSLKCYPDKLNYVDEVLGFCSTYLEGLKQKEKVADYSKPSSVKQIVNLLSIPLENYKNVLTVLRIENYQKLTVYLAHANRKKIAIDMVKNAIENKTIIPEPEQVEKMLEIMGPLVRDEPDQPEMDDLDKEDFEEEQNLVSSLVNLFDNEDPGKLYKIYIIARKAFSGGGVQRIRHTFVPLAFRSLRLVTKIRDGRLDGSLSLEEEDWNKIGKRIFQFAHEVCTQLAKEKAAEAAMRLFLQCAQAASYCNFEPIAYEFVTQAFLIYEADITESKAQYNAILTFIGTLQTLKCFNSDNYDTLVTKTAQQSARLLKKPDQTRAVAICSHLFWADNEHKDGKRVLECLQKSLKIAGPSMDAATSASLIVEILNEYLYYFENRNSDVPAKHITGLIELINTSMANMDSTASESTAINTFYQNTLKYIQTRKESNAEFQDIEVK